MFAKKLTKEQREKLRALRLQVQLINKEAKEKCFEYVVSPPKKAAIAFGSSIERVCLPTSGPALSSFMRRQQGEILDYPGPQEYVWRKQLQKKLASKYGHTAFVSKVQRMPPTLESKNPPIGAYDVDIKKPFKKSTVPFGSSAKVDIRDTQNVPGPPTYPFHEPYPKQRRILAFGKSGFRWPTVYIFCTPYNIAKCHVCNKQPHGDYFYNFEKKLDLCRPCFKERMAKLKACTVDVFRRELEYREYKKFVPARYCGFFHDHNGTTAAVEIMTKAELRKKIRLENYLYQFLKQIK